MACLIWTLGMLIGLIHPKHVVYCSTSLENVNKTELILGNETEKMVIKNSEPNWI